MEFIDQQSSSLSKVIRKSQRGDMLIMVLAALAISAVMITGLMTYLSNVMTATKTAEYKLEATDIPPGVR